MISPKSIKEKEVMLSIKRRKKTGKKIASIRIEFFQLIE
jgi:hypothetical protein